VITPPQVRHGQSTWNAEGRVQGSTDQSVLTEKGLRQAQLTQALLADEQFTELWCSPLQRARQTAAAAWAPRAGEPLILPALREVDLYSLEGRLKSDVVGLEAWRDWHSRPALFSLDGHAPVRELWHRAGLAWAALLSASQQPGRRLLVVAHNASNQALLGAAAGWGPEAFRRFSQSNGGATRLEFSPGAAGAPAVATLTQVNVTAEGWARDGLAGCVVLLASPPGSPPPALFEALRAAPVAAIYHEPAARAFAAGLLSAASVELDASADSDAAAARAWAASAAAAAQALERAECVVLVADAGSLARVVCVALGLPLECAARFSLAGVSVLRPHSGCYATALCLGSLA